MIGCSWPGLLTYIQEVVGWSMGSKFTQALLSKSKAGLLLYSNQGTHYRSDAFLEQAKV